MPAAANEMKAILLEILEMAFQPADVTATQQMGVNMSNAVKRDGVVIIQNQNVEVYARIMPSMVKALRLCDSFEPAVAIAYEPPKLEQGPIVDAEYSNPVDAVCEWMYSKAINWERANELIRESYLRYVCNHFKTKREAAEFLGVGATYLSKLTAGKED